MIYVNYNPLERHEKPQQTFKNIDDVLWKEAACSPELDYTEQSSWMLFLKYLDDLEQERAIEAELRNKPYEFIYRSLRTHKLRELITGSAQGASPTMKKINKGIVQNLPVTFPTLSDQKAIVEKISSLHTKIRHLESIYQQKLTALTELKQPILQKAFVGELAQEKLPALLEVKYSGISDAAASLGSIPGIRDVFIEFQQYLYTRQ